MIHINISHLVTSSAVTNKVYISSRFIDSLHLMIVTLRDAPIIIKANTNSELYLSVDVMILTRANDRTAAQRAASNKKKRKEKIY